MMKKTLKWLVIFISVVFLFGYFFQEKFIFLATQLPQDFKFSFDVDFKEINLKTPDHQTINALHFKAKNPKGIILYFHGNRGDLTRWGEISKWFTQFNYDVFVIDYRGYGKSSGVFNEQKMYADALLAYDYVKKQYPEHQIVVYGRSLGSTFAAKVAAFYNLMSAIKYQIKFSPEFLFNYKFRTNNLMNKVSCPVTFFHGTQDEVTSPEDSNRLFDLVTHPQKKVVKIVDGIHGNLRTFQEYTTNLKAILER